MTISCSAKMKRVAAHDVKLPATSSPRQLLAQEKVMKTTVVPRTVDLTSYPDLVVIYLGMRVRTFAGIKTLLGLGPQIDKAGAQRPEGLLHYENNIIFKLYPLHLGMRWYWRDFESMERWTRSEPHARWWSDFMRHSGGTGF